MVGGHSRVEAGCSDGGGQQQQQQQQRSVGKTGVVDSERKCRLAKQTRGMQTRTKGAAAPTNRRQAQGREVASV